MMKNEGALKYIVEAALLASGRPLSIDSLLTLFLDDEQPDRAAVKAVLAELAEDYAERGIEVREVSSGWRIQVRSQFAPWVSRLWEEKPPRYSRALMETLALIAYRQPITRGEIEEIRGVAVSTQIVKTLLEREWVRVVGHRDVPGKPALYATTRAFLDYFGLTGLDDLPTLSEIKDLDSLNQEFPFIEDNNGGPGTAPEAEAATTVEAGADEAAPSGGGEQEPEPDQAAADEQGDGQAAVPGEDPGTPDADDPAALEALTAAADAADDPDLIDAAAGQTPGPDDFAIDNDLAEGRRGEPAQTKQDGEN